MLKIPFLDVLGLIQQDEVRLSFMVTTVTTVPWSNDEPDVSLGLLVFKLSCWNLFSSLGARLNFSGVWNQSSWPSSWSRATKVNAYKCFTCKSIRISVSLHLHVHNIGKSCQKEWWTNEWMFDNVWKYRAWKSRMTCCGDIISTTRPTSMRYYSYTIPYVSIHLNIWVCRLVPVNLPWYLAILPSK